MPPRAATAASARATRASKTKANVTITAKGKGAVRNRAAATATAAAVAAAAAAAAVSPDPENENPEPPTNPAHPPVDARFQEYDEHFAQLETSLIDIQVAIRSTLNDAFTQLMDRLDGMDATQQLMQLNQPPVLGNTPVSLDVLSRWPWIDRLLVESIANGEFDLNALPKLHQDITLRNRHITKTTDGYHLPIDDGRMEFITSRIKIYTVFKDLPTFLSTWLIYISIHTSYSPERTPGLLIWTEHLVFQYQSGYPWALVLSYVIAYYEKHQCTPIEA
jgi:hypothetical protein